MHIKWDSDAARDISDALNRLVGEMDECVGYTDRAVRILQEMASIEPGEAIRAVAEAVQKVGRGLRAMGRAIEDTGRGVDRSSALFEETEVSLLRAAQLETGASPDRYAEAATWKAVASQISPMFYNVPGRSNTPPVTQAGSGQAPWPAFPGIRQTVVVDWLPGRPELVVPQWLEGYLTVPRVSKETRR